MWRRRSLVRLGAGFVLLAGAPPLAAQARFDAVFREPIAGLQGSEVLTIRDNAMHVCYTLFLINTAPQVVPPLAPFDALTIDSAVAQRDRRLSDLSTELERSTATTMPGTLGPNVLKYEWEGQKVQSAFDHVVREKEIDRLDARLKQLVETPRLAILGPAACRTGTAPSREDPR
jgi:hypothetical protein